MPEHSKCNLNQWLTSATAAMVFAAQNWPQFKKHMEKTLSSPVPINRFTMLHHAAHLSLLINEDKMPR